ncbi:MAG TPA: alkaline phosphatase family protein, partial [Solirubrobacteraceae bacterium]|nr:alkaline phosphatase family protein [Solirubrobacteraceae bacterium]
TGIPAGAFVGTVIDALAGTVGASITVPTVPASATDPADIGGFTLVNSSGVAIDTTGAVSGVTLGARTNATDPLFDATDATTGGGDTGSVLISPYIDPGSVSNVYYNHYSWLRTMEDLFGVGRVSAGVDTEGHLGYAAQPGLAPFGRDVFDNQFGHFFQ